MRRASLIALFVAGGCGGVGALTASESALVGDSQEVDDSDDSLETGVEEPLSGADSTDPGAVDPSTTSAGQMDKIRTNPGLWFKPAGCITTTITGNSASSVFNDCTGPLGLHHYTGTRVEAAAIMQKYIDAMPSESYAGISHFFDPENGSGIYGGVDS